MSEGERRKVCRYMYCLKIKRQLMESIWWVKCDVFLQAILLSLTLWMFSHEIFLPAIGYLTRIGFYICLDDGAKEVRNQNQ